jgi:hypothetical protein
MWRVRDEQTWSEVAKTLTLPTALLGIVGSYWRCRPTYFLISENQAICFPLTSPADWRVGQLPDNVAKFRSKACIWEHASTTYVASVHFAISRVCVLPDQRLQICITSEVFGPIDVTTPTLSLLKSWRYVCEVRHAHIQNRFVIMVELHHDLPITPYNSNPNWLLLAYERQNDEWTCVFSIFEPNIVDGFHQILLVDPAVCFMQPDQVLIMDTLDLDDGTARFHDTCVIECCMLFDYRQCSLDHLPNLVLEASEIKKLQLGILCLDDFCSQF